MCKLLDGPGRGTTFCVSRCPVFLRVVKSHRGIWDVLNELEDEPKPEEEIFPYQRVTQPYGAFIDGTGQHFYMGMADYQFINELVPDSTLRDTVLWQGWCKERIKARKLELVK